MAEMTAIEFLKAKNRMCKNHTMCGDCQIWFARHDKSRDCRFFIYDYPEEIVAIVEKWAKENPVKTILQDFLEKYPNAELNSKGQPRFCPKNLGYAINIDCYRANCFEKCWDEPLEVD